MIPHFAPRKADPEEHGGLPADGMPTPSRYLAIAALSLGTMLTTIDGQIATVALPTIARDLKVDGSAAVLVVTVYQLVLVMTLLPFSALGDRIGLKRLYQGGQLVFTVATLLCFFAKSLPFLLVVRAFQALGAAAALSVMAAMVRLIYPQRVLGRGLAFNTICATMSGALAPTAGGLILAFAPWPWVFAAGVPFAILSLALGRIGLPDAPTRNSSYDRLGAVLCMVTFGLIISGLESSVHGASPLIAAAVTGVGVLVAIVFVRHELTQQRPIMPLDLLRLPVVGLSCAGAMCAFVATSLLTLSLPFRLQHGYGFSPKEVGIAVASWPITMMFVAPVAGTLSDKVPAGLLGSIGMAVGIVGLLFVAFLPTHPSMLDIAWRMSLCGAGFGMFFSPNARLIVGSAPRHRAASAGGLISTTRLTGQTTGATFVAALLASGIGEGRTPPLIGAGLAICAGIASLARLNPALRRPAADEMEADAA
jgi:DHA2 family multidrug resistance protein-like MFS transporter